MPGLTAQQNSTSVPSAASTAGAADGPSGAPDPLRVGSTSGSIASGSESLSPVHCYGGASSHSSSGSSSCFGGVISSAVNSSSSVGVFPSGNGAYLSLQALAGTASLSDVSVGSSYPSVLSESAWLVTDMPKHHHGSQVPWSCSVGGPRPP